MRRLLPALVAATWVWCGSASVLAQASDIVFLPGGGRIRGTVEVYEPGHRVVVLLPDGSRRTLGPRQFERVQFADEPAATPTEPIAPEPPPAEPTPPGPTAPATAAPETTSPPDAVPVVPPPTSDSLAPPTGTPVPDAQAIERMAAATGVAPSTAAEPAVSPVRAYGDGGGAELEWARYPATVPRPVGFLHFGVQVAFTIELWGGVYASDYYGYRRGYYDHSEIFLGGELAPFVDLRFTREFQLRAHVVLGAQSAKSTEEFRDATPPFNQRFGSGVFELGARVLLGLLAGPVVAFRFGGDIGMEVMGGLGSVGWYGGPMFELAFRMLDQENFEIALQLEAQSRSWHYHLDEVGAEYDFSGTTWTPRGGVALAYLF